MNGSVDRFTDGAKIGPAHSIDDKIVVRIKAFVGSRARESEVVGVPIDRECWSVRHAPRIAHRVEIDISFRQETPQAGLIFRVLCRARITSHEYFFEWLK